ncbi:uncharacterized protein BJ171DRAFT_491665 [Polychytrium aggregatum]|uniref:uncharacterized protein n=1 Tax=Polychytrium aggregatum TaxID=110093 RepID=UPI0022FED3E7|nr:uncharacterized protein BJ171DRAFT_491665 [Polychytrium aggregatum]KAI9207833.1 hypothetical protein BJ171DRAFT_491665 [Polychytrium aggregatum]
MHFFCHACQGIILVLDLGQGLNKPQLTLLWPITSSHRCSGALHPLCHQPNQRTNGPALSATALPLIRTRIGLIAKLAPVSTLALLLDPINMAAAPQQGSTAPPSSSSSEPVKVAVIGSGLAGLTTAFLLSSLQDDITHARVFEVHLFEKSSSLGMDSASIPVPCECSDCASSDKAKDSEALKQPSEPHQTGRIDVPMRSFFPEYYPVLTKVYKYLGITTQVTDNSMSFFNLANNPSEPTEFFPLPSTFPHNNPLSPSASPALSRGSNGNESKQPSGTKPAASGTNHAYFTFSTHYIPFTNNTFSTPDLPSLFLLLTHPLAFLGFWVRIVRVCLDYLRLLAISKWAYSRNELLTYRPGQISSESPFASMTVGEFFRKYRFSNEFARDAFLPLFSGVCTCSFASLEQFPVAAVLEYVARCMPFGRMSFVDCGINTVCHKLSRNVDHVHLSTRIVRVEPLVSPKPKLSPFGTPLVRVETDQGKVFEFAHVVFATQANQAAQLLRQSSQQAGSDAADSAGDFDHAEQDQIKTLDRFKYERSLVVCHTDESLLPANPLLWRCMNFAHVQRSDPSLSPSSRGDESSISYSPQDVSMCTHYINISQPNLPRRIFQTTNPIMMPDPEKQIHSTWFERAVVTWDSMMAIDDLNMLQGKGQRWFVGSYAYPGIPLLEGCVVTAIDVAQGIALACGGRRLVPEWER